MGLGGVCLHGNGKARLAACLESLAAVCDEVVAVDSGSSDGSAQLVLGAGVRAVSHPWQGYGAARARAVSELRACDWLFYLDSHERLEPPARERIVQWKKKLPVDLRAQPLAGRDCSEVTGR